MTKSPVLEMRDECDVCGRPGEGGVCSSAYVPYSSFKCVECLRHYAEEEWIGLFLWEDVAHKNLDNLVPQMRAMIFWSRGAYRTLEEIVKERDDAPRRPDASD